jgi:arylformamidase
VTGRFVDLSQALYDGMPGLALAPPGTTPEPFRVRVRPYLDYESSEPLYEGRARFRLTELHTQGSLGTYVDAPAVRHEGGIDIAGLPLERLIVPGVAVDLRGREPEAGVGLDSLALPEGLGGRAVLLCSGWDRHWGTPEYARHPFVTAEVIDALVEADVALVGFDTPNADSPRDPERPAHTRLLAAGIPIVENLRGLDALLGRSFRLYALPARVQGATSMPIRAVAELEG